jgi:hypothetical protein
MRTLRLIGTTLLMVVLCLNFTACGDDDDDDPSNPIVGVWQNDDEGEHLRWTFNADGSGSEYLYYDDDSESFTYQFTYTYHSETNVIEINYSDGDTDRYNVTINGNTLTAKNEYGTEITFKKK